MHEFQSKFHSKKPFRRFFYSPLVIGILFVLCLFLLNAAWNVHVKEQASQDALNRSRHELEKLSDRKKTLETAVAYLATPQGVETEIRQKFRAAREGESVAVITDDRAQTGSTSSTTDEQVHEDSWWSRLLRGFGL